VPKHVEKQHVELLVGFKTLFYINNNKYSIIKLNMARNQSIDFIIHHSQKFVMLTQIIPDTWP